jgi:hypothetical protein
MKSFIYTFIFYLLFSFLLPSSSNGQYLATDVRHYFRFETGYRKYFVRTLTVDPQPDWLGYQLTNEQDAWSVNLAWGWDFDEKTLLGFGGGYLNYEGINGLQIFSDVNFFVSNSYVNPYLGFRAGYSHIWNQYENGSGSFTGSFLAGIQFRLGDCSLLKLYVQSGLQYSHQALFIPVALGFQF